MGPLRRAWHWFGDRTGLEKAIRPLTEHAVPPRTTSMKTGWAYVFGSATLFLFILQAVTGTMLATNYIPSPANAYDSLQHITDVALLGNLVRGMHFFGASAMVILMGIHMARVFLTASYKFPREVNWLTGVVLLVLTLTMAFTGQLLRWDQNGIWTVVVGAFFAGRVPLVGPWLGEFILAGETLGGATLSRFFAFHVFLVPFLIVMFIIFHIHLVLHNGISEPPEAGRPVDPKTYREWYWRQMARYGRPYWPDAAWKEAVFGVGIIATVVVLALIFGPRQLGDPPDPTILETNPQPDWFLIWYYALLAVKAPELDDLVMVYLPLLVLFLLVLLPFVANRGERSPSQRPWAIAIVGVVVIGLGTLIGLGLRAPWVPNYTTVPLTAEQLGPAPPEVQRGALLFHAKGCQYCHTVAGQGGSYGPELTNVAKRLPPEEVTVRIVKGFGNMPAYRDNLTPPELDEIVLFLRWLGQSGRGSR